MADNTQLPSVATGGDTIRTDSLTGGTDPTSGLPVPLNSATGTSPEVKAQIVKVATGLKGFDGGVVYRDNAFPVIDYRALAQLEKLVDIEDESRMLLREIRDLIKKGH